MATKGKQQASEAGDERQPLAEPEGGWPPDEFTGIGGTYIRDPFTGIRRPADEPATEVPPTDTNDAA